MAKEVTNPVTDFSITLLGSFGGLLRGWIELLNGAEPAGYVYLTDQTPLPADRLSSAGTYVVMHQPASAMGDLLGILRNERSVHIRLFDPENGEAPSTFLETPGTRIGEHEDPRV